MLGAGASVQIQCLWMVAKQLAKDCKQLQTVIGVAVITKFSTGAHNRALIRTPTDMVLCLRTV